MTNMFGIPAPVAQKAAHKGQTRAQNVRKTDKIIEYTTTLRLDDFRPIVLFKSHSDPLSDQTCELISAMAPEPLEIHEILLLIAKETTKGQDLSKLDKVEQEVEDRAELRERVYNAMAYHIRKTPEVFYSNNRPILIPYGDPRTTMLVAYMLEGLFSERVKILNLITVGGVRIPNPKEPLLDLDKSYYAGRKLRDLRDRCFDTSVTRAREARSGVD